MEERTRLIKYKQHNRGCMYHCAIKVSSPERFRICYDKLNIHFTVVSFVFEVATIFFIISKQAKHIHKLPTQILYTIILNGSSLQLNVFHFNYYTTGPLILLNFSLIYSLWYTTLYNIMFLWVICDYFKRDDDDIMINNSNFNIFRMIWKPV